MFLDVRITPKQRFRSQGDGDFRREVSGNSSEASSGHTDDRERLALYFQNLANDGAVSAIVTLPESIAEHGHWSGDGGIQVNIFPLNQTSQFRCGAQFGIEISRDGPDVASRQCSVCLDVEHGVAPPRKH